MPDFIEISDSDNENDNGRSRSRSVAPAGRERAPAASSKKSKAGGAKETKKRKQDADGHDDDNDDDQDDDEVEAEDSARGGGRARKASNNKNKKAKISLGLTSPEEKQTLADWAQGKGSLEGLTPAKVKSLENVLRLRQEDRKLRLAVHDRALEYMRTMASLQPLMRSEQAPAVQQRARELYDRLEQAMNNKPDLGSYGFASESEQ